MIKLPKQDMKLHFVNRTEEQEFIKRLAKDAEHNVPVQKCIVNFYGIPGIGKTALLTALNESLCSNSDVTTLFLDMSAIAVGESSVRTKALVLRAFGHIKGASEWSSFLSSDPDTLPMDETTIDAETTRLIEFLSELSHPIIFLSDGIDLLPEMIFKWFESNILLPILQIPRQHLIVLSSQVELRWSKMSLRRRVNPYQLLPLTKDSISQLASHNAHIKDMVFSITVGHPLSIVTLFQQFEQQPVTTEWLAQHEKVMSRRVAETLIDHIVKNGGTELREVLRILSLLREFDVATLRTILPQFLVTFQSRSQSALLVTIKQLQETTIVRWNGERRAYQIDPTVRSILSNDLFLNMSSQYGEIQVAAKNHYNLLMESSLSNQNMYLLEYMYHYILSNADTLSDKAVQVSFEQKLLHLYVSRDGQCNKSALEKVFHRIEEDEELLLTLARFNLPENILLKTIQKLEKQY